MKILITGATGLVGSEIVKQCHAKGYVVHYLTTRKNKIKTIENYKGFYWNPAKNEIDTNCLNGVDAIINLAGATVSKRWTSSYKQLIYYSRIQSLQVLFRLLSENEHTIKHVSSASGISIYESSLSEKYSEDSQKISTAFLGKVVVDWEKEADKFTELGLTVSKVRTGIVLSKNGGALEKMAQPIKYGFGAALGSGKQWQSWIHVEDIANMYLFLIEKNIAGAFNAVADNPVTNKVLTKAIAKQLKKPLFLPNVPAFMLKLLLGEMSTIVLESQFVTNDKIRQEGFQFDFESVDKALNSSI